MGGEGVVGGWCRGVLWGGGVGGRVVGGGVGGWCRGAL